MQFCFGRYRKDFNNVGELLDQRKTVGEVAVLEQGTRFIFYLITKQNSSGKPTMETVRQAIKSLRDECLKRGVEKLAMPRIGCGLDRLSWRNVKDALNEEFSSMDIELVVYNFREVSVVFCFYFDCRNSIVIDQQLYTISLAMV